MRVGGTIRYKSTEFLKYEMFVRELSEEITLSNYISENNLMVFDHNIFGNTIRYVPEHNRKC